jgi:hypothetical protein
MIMKLKNQRPRPKGAAEPVKKILLTVSDLINLGPDSRGNCYD